MRLSSGSGSPYDGIPLVPRIIAMVIRAIAFAMGIYLAMCRSFIHFMRFILCSL